MPVLLQDLDRILHGDVDESNLELCAKVAQAVCGQGWLSTFLATVNHALKYAPLTTLVDVYGQQWLQAAVTSGKFKLVAQVHGLAHQLDNPCHPLCLTADRMPYLIKLLCIPGTVLLLSLAYIFVLFRWSTALPLQSVYLI